jgi:Leucine-rich repeat (LRR) protein
MLALPAALADCQQLAYLAVVGRRLIGLPESLGKLTHLSSLLMDGRADSLTGQGRGQVLALPASLANCRELTSLSMLNQQQFDGAECLQLAARLPYLKHLVLINCGISGLDGIPWKSLSATTLNLSQNRISQLPAALLDMPNLEQANFSDTNLPGHLSRFFLHRTSLIDALKKQAE